jgi:hypothetical protein
MKRVVGGKSYNTETAERIAHTEGSYEKDGRRGTWEYEITLYRTPKTAWFTVEREWRENDEDSIRTTFETLTLDEAIAWVKQYSCELFNGEYFPAIEEA